MSLAMRRTWVCCAGSSDTSAASRRTWPGYCWSAWFHGSSVLSLPLPTKPRRPFSRVITDFWSSLPAVIASCERSASCPASRWPRTATIRRTKAAPRISVITPVTRTTRAVIPRWCLKSVFRMRKGAPLRTPSGHCNPSGGRRPAPVRGLRLGRLLEDQPKVVEHLALEADAVRAHARREREPEVPAREVLRHEARLEQRLLEARLGEARAPLLDGLDVVEPAAHGADEAEVRGGRLLDLLLAERQERARELVLHERDVPGVGVARSVDRDLLDRDHVAAEHHRLEVEAAPHRQRGGHVREQVAVDLVLAAGVEVLGRAEVLEGAEAGDGVERAERVARDLAGVAQVHVEPVPLAGRLLGAREGHADARAALLPHEVEQRAPAAAEVEYAATGFDADLLRHVLVLAALRLLEGLREVAVVLRAAEVGELAEAEPEDAVDQRVGELEVLALGHAAG